MKIISFVENDALIKKRLWHPGVWHLEFKMVETMALTSSITLVMLSISLIVLWLEA
jgi:hypothetical protein